jgi:hypothetical protein
MLSDTRCEIAAVYDCLANVRGDIGRRRNNSRFNVEQECLDEDYSAKASFDSLGFMTASLTHCFCEESRVNEKIGKSSALPERVLSALPERVLLVGLLVNRIVYRD